MRGVERFSGMAAHSLSSVSRNPSYRFPWEGEAPSEPLIGYRFPWEGEAPSELLIAPASTESL